MSVLTEELAKAGLPRTMISDIEGKIGEEVMAAAEFHQGKPPSMAAMLTGLALIDLIRPRRSKALPKRFLLAVTADRVIAFRGLGISDEDGNDQGAYIRSEFASWPRDQVSVAAVPGEDESKAFVLEVAGERVPVFSPSLGDPAVAEAARLPVR